MKYEIKTKYNLDEEYYFIPKEVYLNHTETRSEFNKRYEWNVIFYGKISDIRVDYFSLTDKEYEPRLTYEFRKNKYHSNYAFEDYIFKTIEEAESKLEELKNKDLEEVRKNEKETRESKKAEEKWEYEKAKKIVEEYDKKNKSL